MKGATDTKDKETLIYFVKGTIDYTLKLFILR